MAHCFFKKSGVSTGTGKYAHGSFTTSTSSNTKITLGFKPKTLALMIANNLNYFDESISTTQYKFATPSTNMTNINLGNTTAGRLTSIDDDGFTINSYSSALTCYYHAVG